MNLSFSGVVVYDKESKAFEVESHSLVDVFEFNFDVEVLCYCEEAQ